jgi:hypothetical protein
VERTGRQPTCVPGKVQRAVLLLLLLLFFNGKDTIPFTHGIYTYIPHTNPVPKQYNVTAILSLLFMVPISLAAVLALMYFYIRTFRSMCAVPNMAVLCSSLASLSLNYYYFFLLSNPITALDRP